MSGERETLIRAQAYVRANLLGLCRGEMQWQDTGLLGSPEFRKLRNILAFAGSSADPVAKALIYRRAMEVISELDQTLDGEQDIDGRGGPNTAMRVMTIIGGQG